MGPVERGSARQERRSQPMLSIGIEGATIGCALAALGLLLSWGMYLPIGAYYGGTAMEALFGPASSPPFSTDWIIVFVAVLGIFVSGAIVVAARVRAARWWVLLALTLSSAATLLILLLLPAMPYKDHLLAFATFNAPGYLLAVLGMLACLCAAAMASITDPTVEPSRGAGKTTVFGWTQGASSMASSTKGTFYLDRVRLIRWVGGITAVIGAYLYLSQYEEVIVGPIHPPSQTLRAAALGVYGSGYRIAFGLWLLFALAGVAAMLAFQRWRGVRPVVIHAAIELAGFVAAFVVLVAPLAPEDVIPTALSLSFESIGLFGFGAALVSDVLLLRLLRTQINSKGEMQDSDARADVRAG